MITATRLWLPAMAAVLLGGCGGAGGAPKSRCEGVVCQALDQCHLAGTCDAATGLCSNPTRADGVACDDGSACTSDDACQAGACAGTPRVCLASDQCHEATCDAATGSCSEAARADGSPCDDLDGCTQPDVCTGGQCAGGPPVVCTTSTPCEVPGTCDALTGLCSSTPAPDGTPCSDGDLCTRIDSCQGGACLGSDPVVCSAPDDCHEAGACDWATGTCAGLERPDGSTCDDHDLCTVGDSCRGGACTGGLPKTCPHVPCRALVACQRPAGSCPQGVVLPDGTPCELGEGFGLCAAGTCQPLAGPEGAYHVRGLAAYAWNGWSDGRMALDATGACTDFWMEYSDGTSSFVSPFPRLVIDSRGQLTVPYFPGFWGTYSLDGAEAVASYVDLEGSAELVVLAREGAGLGQADLAGTWQAHELAVGTTPAGEASWYRGPVTIAADGATSRTAEDRNGWPHAESYRSVVASTGLVERAYTPSTPSRGRAALSPSRRLLAGVWARLEGGFSLEVAVRTSLSHGISEVSGSWSFHVLTAAATSALRTAVGHGAFEVSPSGQLAVVYQRWSAPELALPDGQLEIDEDGGVVHGALWSFRGHLADDGNTLVATFTEDGGADGLLIALRRHAPPAMPVLDQAAAASAWIGPAGGVLQATAAGGTRYRLELPPGALASGQSASISMTPMTSMPDLPMAGTLLGGVQLAPEGLALHVPARLTIALPAGQAPASVLGFTYPGTGADQVGFLRAASGGAPGDLTLDLLHFSGTGAAAGTAGQQASSDQAFADQLSNIANAALARGEGLDDPGVAQAIQDTLAGWAGYIVDHAAASASTLDQLLDGPLASVLRWSEPIQLLGLGEGWCDTAPAASVAALNSILRVKIPAFIDAINRLCESEPSICLKAELMKKLLRWNAYVQLAGENMLGCLPLAETDLCTACGGKAGDLPMSVNILCGQPLASCSGLTLSVGESAGLTPSFRNLCREEVGASDTNPDGALPDWRSTKPSVASVSSGGVLALCPGQTTVTLQPQGVPCLQTALPVKVLPRTLDAGGGQLHYTVTVTDMQLTSHNLDCDFVTGPPEPYTVDFWLSPQGVDWVSRTVNSGETSNGVNGSYSLGRFLFKTEADNVHIKDFPRLGTTIIHRTWHLQGSEAGMRGYYEWSWYGLTIHNGRPTGCSGVNDVVVVPWEPVP